MLGKNGLKGIISAPLVTAEAPAPIEEDRRVLVRGTPLARALYEVMSGTPVVSIDSPPGAGKTTLTCELVRQLVERTDLVVGIATPTGRGAVDVAHRLAALMGGDRSNRLVALQSKWHTPEMERHGIDPEIQDETRPHVFTVASAGFRQRPLDVLVVDEAYQVTFADFVKAADDAQQIVLVGDPGQIGPVVTVDTSMFDLGGSPDARCPEVMQQRDYTVRIPMQTTYRLGQTTVEVIAPLYDFEFSSSRADRHLVDDQGVVPEIETILVEPVGGRDGIEPMSKVVDEVEHLLTCQLVTQDGTRDLEPADIAVVVPHNDQLIRIGAVLSARGITGISIGTADSMQGGQWHAVVAVDSVFGYDLASAHSLSPGRLCVMLSRHMTHLTWIHDGNWEAALDDPDLDQTEAELGREVRERVMGV